jgi:hypothetical protein
MTLLALYANAGNPLYGIGVHVGVLIGNITVDMNVTIPRTLPAFELSVSMVKVKDAVLTYTTISPLGTKTVKRGT